MVTLAEAKRNALNIPAAPARDEIGEMVSRCLLLPEVAVQKKQLADTLLPCERMGNEWPNFISTRIDAELAATFPLIDLDSVLGMMHA